MALETGNYISDLVQTNPTGSDPIAYGDDHIRLLKKTIKQTFPNISGAVTKTHTAINNIPDNTTQAIQDLTDAADAAFASVAASLDTKVDKATQIVAGAGLAGGGDLSADRTLSIPNGGVVGSMLSSGAAVANIGFTPADSAAFGKSLGTSGYQKLPGGLILQWGIASNPGSGSAQVTFPIAFPTACVNVQVTSIFNGKHGGAVDSGHPVTTTSFYGGVGEGGVDNWQAANWYWFAIGY